MLKEQGKSDSDIRAAFGMELEQYEKFSKECLLCEAEKLKCKNVGEVYVEYLLNQKKCIADLERMATKFDQVKHYSALVQAVKTRSDIYDKIIKVGQDFGLLEKKPERREVVAGVLVAKMDNDQLRSTILGELTSMEKLMEMYGDQNIIDVLPGPLHREYLPAPVLDSLDSAVPLLKGHKTKTHVVSSGRRVVKKKLPI
jgi:hypothetical protein